MVDPMIAWGAVALLAYAFVGEAAAAPPAPPAAPVAAAHVALKPWTVDAAASSLAFRATQSGKPFDGRFQRFQTTILFDPSRLDASSITVVVDMTSAKTGDGQRDTALPTADWFDAKKFPSAKFVSTRIVSKGAGRYEAEGALTIRDASVPLKLPFTLTMAGDKGTARGAVTLQRQKFGVGRGEFANDTWVGFGVGVSFVIVATRPA